MNKFYVSFKYARFHCVCGMKIVVSHGYAMRATCKVSAIQFVSSVAVSSGNRKVLAYQCICTGEQHVNSLSDRVLPIVYKTCNEQDRPSKAGPDILFCIYSQTRRIKINS